MTVQQLCVLGSTGSIGQNTLDVVRRHPRRWQVYALTANKSVDAMLEQCREFRPQIVVMRDPGAAAQLQSKLQQEQLLCEVLAGAEGLKTVAAASEVDIVMAAIVGGAGLESSLAAATAGKKILLANKESLVMSGRLFMQAVEQSGACLLPIDSEHNAIFQCMPAAYTTGQRPAEVQRILLTGSGGPFRTLPMEDMAAVTPEQAVRHPNWSMGAKISVDSATMMNKGLELVEAVWLFAIDAADVDIVVHPQSVIHSMVQYNDGSVLAQLGNPDMRTPIAHGLAWPERVDAGVQALDIVEIAQLAFEAPDYQRFPCLRLAREAAEKGGSYSCVMNAANEIAVDAFLAGRLGFDAIPHLIESTLSLGSPVELSSIDEVIELDAQARHFAEAALAQTV